MSDDARQLIFRVHAVQRMFERGLTANDVSAVTCRVSSDQSLLENGPFVPGSAQTIS